MTNLFLIGIRKMAEDSGELLMRAFNQIERSTGSIARPAPSTKKEPTHINYGNQMHYGIGRYGEHIGTILNGSNVHVYKNKIFVLTPNGGAFTLPLSGENAERAAALLTQLRDRSAPWAKAASLWYELKRELR